jgi:hypothetical protein
MLHIPILRFSLVFHQVRGKNDCPLRADTEIGPTSARRGSASSLVRVNSELDALSAVMGALSLDSRAAGSAGAAVRSSGSGGTGPAPLRIPKKDPGLANAKAALTDSHRAANSPADAKTHHNNNPHNTSRAAADFTRGEPGRSAESTQRPRPRAADDLLPRARANANADPSTRQHPNRSSPDIMADGLNSAGNARGVDKCDAVGDSGAFSYKGDGEWPEGKEVAGA